MGGKFSHTHSIRSLSTMNRSGHVDVSAVSCTNPGTMNLAGHVGLSEGEKFRDEKAAIKARAALHGFLAHRAFRALKGIIRLQALVRGHLVRRYVIATLRSILGIIKLHAIARGQKCDQGEPNSVANWMNRWTFSQFWKLIKKSLDTNFHPNFESYAMEMESGRLKRNAHRNPLSELGKVNRILRKVLSSFFQPDTREHNIDAIALTLNDIPDDMIANPPADSNPLPSVDKEENKQTCDE